MLRFCISVFMIVGFFMTACAGGGEKPHIVFVVGDDEYRSEITMPLMAKILEEQHGFKCSMTYAVVPETGEKIPQYRQYIEGLEALKTADLAVFYLRFRRLPDDQMDLILNYVKSGKPMIGFRTTTHAFRFPEGHKYENLNSDFGTDVFGQKWISHPGGSTRIVKNLADHPIMRGIQDEFWMLGDLYRVVPLHGTCTPLLTGYAVKEYSEFVTGEDGKEEVNYEPRAKGIPPSPIAWTKTDNNTRVFFTTMGHPKDFARLPVRRLTVNAIYWALERESEIPAEGCKAEIVGEFDAPDLSEASEYKGPE